MVEARRPSRTDVALRVAAALGGSLPPAVLACVALARYLPAGPEVAFAWGFALVLPAWVLAMCLVFLARTAARAWVGCALVSALLAVLVYAVPQAPAAGDATRGTVSGRVE